MANDIRVCEKCNHIRLKSIVPKLEKMAPGTEVKIGCKSYCGPCAKRALFSSMAGISVLQQKMKC